MYNFDEYKFYVLLIHLLNQGYRIGSIRTDGNEFVFEVALGELGPLSGCIMIWEETWMFDLGDPVMISRIKKQVILS